MKKNLILILSVLLLLVLTACGGGAAAEAGAVQDEKSGQTEVNSDFFDESAADGTNPAAGQMGGPTQLAIGTYLLEGTDLAVTTEQAEALLPLWKAVRSLSQSENITQDELNALFTQIEGEMTEPQLAQMQELVSDSQNMRALMEELGIESALGTRFGNMDPEMQATREAMRESGEMPEGFTGRPGGGMGPGGGGGGGFGGGVPGEGGMLLGGGDGEGTTVQRGAGMFGDMGTELYDAIITLLEGKN